MKFIELKDGTFINLELVVGITYKQPQDDKWRIEYHFGNRASSDDIFDTKELRDARLLELKTILGIEE